jgi:pilus assembly protein CpaB
MKPVRPLTFAIVTAVFGLAALLMAQPCLQRGAHSTTGERATLSAVVDDGMRALSVRINDVLGVAGFVLPGDRVDILLTRKSFTDILLQNVKVLAIDQIADERVEKPSLAKTATLEVNTIDAQKLTLAQTVGSLSLALRAAGSVEAAAPRRITLSELGPGQSRV